MKQRQILLIKTQAIGDLLLITPAIKAIRKKYAGASLTLLTGKWSAEIVCLNPYFDKIITFDDNIFFQPNRLAIIRLVRQIRKKHFDQAYIFHQSPMIHLMAFFFKIPIRIGFASGWERFLLTSWKKPDAPLNRYVTDVFLDLIKDKDISKPAALPELFLDRRAEDFGADFYQKNDLADKKVVIVFAGGGHNPAEIITAKCFPLELFAGIINRLGEDREIRIVLIGGQGDRKKVARLKRLTNSVCLDLCGRTSLLETAAVIKRASLLITNDSAPLHMAVALATPSLSFFGPTSSRSLVPDNPLHICIQSPVECSPCYNFSRFPGCHDPKCLQAMNPMEIVKKAKAQLL